MTEPDPEANASTGEPDTARHANNLEVAQQFGVPGPINDGTYDDTGRYADPSSGASAQTGQALDLPTEAADHPPPLVRAADLDYGSAARRLFAGLGFTVPAGSFALVTGPAGSGKSTLLLALTGRMSGLTGRLEVAGQDAIARPRRVRAITSVARISGVIDLEPQHRVIDAISDRAGVDGMSRKGSRREFDAACSALGAELGPKQLIGDLDIVQQGVLSAILGTLRGTQLVVFDDLHRGLRVDDQDLLAATLLRLADSGITVVASSVEPTIVGADIVRIPLPSTPGR